MSKKVLIVVNSIAGKFKINKYISKIKENLENSNFDVMIKYTTLEDNAQNIVINCTEEYEIVFVCGGDGTLNQVIQGICKTNKKVKIAYIPTGTTNDFAKTLKLPFNKLELSKNINNCLIKETDVGLFNEKYFGYVASIGLFSKTSYATSFKLKNRFGRLAYLVLGINEIFHYKSYHLKLISEGNAIEDEFIYGSVSNSEYIGGFQLFKNEKIELNDGKFEVLFVKKPKNLWQTIKLTLKVINGNLSDENISYFKTSELKLESPEETEWSIDGEYSGKVKNIRILCSNKKMEFLIPKE